MASFAAFIMGCGAGIVCYATGVTTTWWAAALIGVGVWFVMWVIIRKAHGDSAGDIAGAFFDVGDGIGGGDGGGDGGGGGD